MLVRDNKYIPKEDKDFFILLRVGLWQKVEEELSDNPDWDYIYTLATEQTVQGIIADGIGIAISKGLLKIDENISGEQYKRFLDVTAQIIKRNYDVNKLQSKLCQLFNTPSSLTTLFPNSRISESQNSSNPESQSSSVPELPNSRTPEFPNSNNTPLTYVILKGQSVARFYPKPNLRCSGDIDIFFDYPTYERAKQLIAPLADSMDPESSIEKHIGYFIGDIEVELHADDAYTIGGQKRFHLLLSQMLSQGQLSTFICNGVTVSTATPTFDVLYSFLHGHRHFHEEELGIRQLCDLAMLVHANYGKLDTGWLYNNIKSFRVRSDWQKFMGFLVEYLGLPESEATLGSLQPDTANSFAIWQQCRSTGNFGRSKVYDEKFEIANFFKRNVILFVLRQKIFINMFKYTPMVAVKELFGYYSMYIKIAYRKIFHIGGAKFRI